LINCMDQTTPKTGALDSTLLVTLTVEQLRDLIRNEVQRVIAPTKRITLNPGSGCSSQKAYLTVKEAADFARLAPSTIRLYIRQRKLRARKVGRRVIIAREELDVFLSQNPIEVQSQ
jgi:excisionase family DNA binding protein